MNAADKTLLEKITDLNLSDKNAYNIRKNGKAIKRNITKDVRIESKEDGSGIDIFVRKNAKNALIIIPVIINESGLSDVVYNDFHVEANASCIILAGCAINNDHNKESSHQGIHRFYLSENSDVKYYEKHYGTGTGEGHKVLDPITELYLKKGSNMHIETTQIEGVDSTIRYTKGKIEENATLTITEKIMTHKNQTAKTEFDLDLDGNNSSAHIVSRSVATGKSKQLFISRVNGNNNCYAHVECDAILKDCGVVTAIPEVTANHLDANLIHEATIGKIAGEQLIKLMTLGLSEQDAEQQIINGFLK